MNPHIVKLIEEYGEIKKREGVLEAEIHHHISMLSTLGNEERQPKAEKKQKQEEVEEVDEKQDHKKFAGLRNFLREWIKANGLNPMTVKPKEVMDATSRQFPGVTRGSIGSALQGLRRENNASSK